MKIQLDIFFVALLATFVVWCCVVVVSARETEGNRQNSILLNGDWEFALGEGSEKGETGAGQSFLEWQPITLPGPIKAIGAAERAVSDQTKYLWVRRDFNVTPEQAASLSVLRWNRIACGAEAFINGVKVGENEPTGPYQTLVRSGVIKSGVNQIVLKVNGGVSVRRSKSGSALIPAGFGVGSPEITDDIWIDFAAGAYIKWALAIPDIKTNKVTIRVTPVCLKHIDALYITAEVHDISVAPSPEKAMFPNTVVGAATVPIASVKPTTDPLGGEHFYIDVPMPNFKEWDHCNQQLYKANVKLTKDGNVCDEMTFVFGMREIGAKDGDYKLNGKTIRFHGSNLVFEWNWGDITKNKEIDYLVTEAREMSMNSFRTHTQPPPRLWSDVCDNHGTMILAEFPVLYNYQDYKFTTDEYKIWHRNVLTDSAGWMARLWNHPSVVMWVLSNESNNDNTWEETVFQDFVNQLDPTRPTMRTGTTGTRDNLDLHLCGNITDTAEGALISNSVYWSRDAKDRTLTITEYMNYFGHPYTQWAGINDSTANDIAVAQIGAEHTEEMRRKRIDAVLPYMYAGWTRTRLEARVKEGRLKSAVWKSRYANPQSAAWHSTLSPMLASLELFNANYIAGQEVSTDLYLINDSWNDAAIHVDIVVTKDNPEWIPEATCFGNPIRCWAYDFTIEAGSLEKKPITWQLPEEEGDYWITAKTTGVGISGRPVLSQRFVRAVLPPVASEKMRNTNYVLFGGNDVARRFFSEMDLRVIEIAEHNESFNTSSLTPDQYVVVIWDSQNVNASQRRHAKALCNFASQGGQIIVVASPAWNWNELCNVKTTAEPRFSRVFPADGIHLKDRFGCDPHWLIRWNTPHGTVACGRIDNSETGVKLLDKAKKILWAKEPDTTVVALVPATSGTGKVLFSQLDFEPHLNRQDKEYDPVAVQVLLRFLEMTYSAD